MIKYSMSRNKLFTMIGANDSEKISRELFHINCGSSLDTQNLEHDNELISEPMEGLAATDKFINDKGIISKKVGSKNQRASLSF